MNIKNVLIRKMLENRCYTDEYLYDINNPDHGSLKDVDECCAELKDIHDSGQVLTVLPDFDIHNPTPFLVSDKTSCLSIILL